MKSKRVILDTNLWISFLISKDLRDIDDLIMSGKIIIVFSKELIEEFLTVIQRPKLRKYFTAEKVEDLLRVIDKYGTLFRVKTSVNLCRDKKDNFLLNLAIDSKANFLVSGDKDILVIKEIKKTKIVTWSQFIEIIKK